MLGMKRRQAVTKLIVALIAVLMMVTWSGLDNAAHAAFWSRSKAADASQTPGKKAGKIAEASPPIALQELRQALDEYQPQVSILSPRKD